MTRRNPSFASRDGWIARLREGGHGIEEGHWPDPNRGLNAYTLFQAGSSTARTLAVLAHGTGNDHIFTFQPLIEALLRKGVSVLSFDLPGHGLRSSTNLDRGLFSGGHGLWSFLEHRGFAGWERIGIGYSLGALFLLGTNEGSPLPFHSFILLALPRRIRLGPRFLLHESLSLLSPAVFQQWKLYGWRETLPAAGSFRREDFPIRLSDAGSSSYPQFVARLFEDHPPESYLRNLSQKCILIQGSLDRLAPPSDSAHWRRMNPNLSLITVDRANHFLLPFLQTTIDIIIREIP